LDLSEVRSGTTTRHPWELARAQAILQILGRQASFDAVLDYGCGDGFTGREVQTTFSAAELVGVDTELAPSSCGLRPVPEGTHELYRDEAQLADRKFDLLLLCDVIEHVASDRDFMRGVADRRLRPGALALVTVPAFQSLFTGHDRALRHFRRYSLSELRAAVTDAGFQLLDSGYLFSSLLLPRLLSKVLESLRGNGGHAQHGIGSWQGGPAATRWLSRALELDNTLLLGAQRLGLVIPGLSIWALCKTP
jgi:SAM-dependent methyltransferase